MSVRYRAQGIILGAEDRFEADRAFWVCTKEFGLVVLWAVSCRKIVSKLRGGLIPFSLANIEFVQGRHRKTITDASVSCLLARPGNLEGLRVASRIAETARALFPREDADERAWEVLLESLRLCARVASSREGRRVYYTFFWRAMECMGYGVPGEFHGALLGSAALTPLEERSIAKATRERFSEIFVRI